MIQEQTGSDQIEQEKATHQAPKQNPRTSVRDFVNSPYLFIFIPLLLGGFYLIAHPEYIKLGMDHPYAVAFILALPICVFAIKLVINFFSVIEKWIRLQFEKARQSKKGFFFELVIVVFMFVSICEAGPFFNDIQHNILNGVLGYITVLAFDLIAVVCIDARRKELAKGGSRSGIYLLGVIICALVSMTANLYSALQNFHTPADPSIPTFLKSVAPYIGIMFPVMIVFLAFSRDTEIEIDDAEAYRKQQQKRIDFLAAKREVLEKVIREMEQIGLLQQREFFLKSIFFTKKKIAHVIDVVTTKVVDQVHEEIKTLKAEMQQKERAMAEQAIQTLSWEMRKLADDMQAKLQADLQRSAQNQAKLQTAITDLQSAKTLVADLQNQLQEATLQVARPSAKMPTDTIITLDQERTKHDAAGSSKAKVSDAEILAFIAANPGMKNADIAQKLGISERKIYLAKSSQMLLTRFCKRVEQRLAL